jgi:hypothetical protein
MPDSTLSRRSAALLRVDPGNGCFPRRINFTRKLQKNHSLGFPGTLFMNDVLELVQFEEFFEALKGPCAA